MTTSLLLVHSPLVGPSSWAAAARLASGRGFDVAVPDLTAVAAAEPPRWETFVRTASDAAAVLPAPVAVVGHSGAGAFLPAIAGRLGEPAAALVFVDAVVPPPRGEHEPSPALLALLDDRTEDGLLLPWLDWWPEDVVSDLLPDPADRRLLRRGIPRLPRSFYDEPVPVPGGWSERPCAYLRLSAAYEAEYEEAGARGWPRRQLDTSHLAIHTEPRPVVDAIGSLLGELSSR